MGRTPAAIGLGALALSAAVWACAGLEGLTQYQGCSDGCIDSGTMDELPASGEGGASGSDAAEAGPGFDAATDSAPAGGEDATDEGDDGAAEDGAAVEAGACSGPSIGASGIFVTPLGTDGLGCGTSPATPCKTIGGGIASATATAGSTTVYVASGTYVEKLTLAAGITVQGGWQVSGTTWTNDCGQGDVVVQAPSGSNTTVLADAINGAAALSTMTVLSISASSVQPGQSLYGIFARGSSTQLALNDVVVSVAKAGDGQTGAAGGAGSVPPSSCSSGNGQNNVTPGTVGTGASPGTFSAAGFAPSAGSTGSAGNAGSNGTAAPSPTSVSYSTCTQPMFGPCKMNQGSSSCTATAGTSGCGGGGGGGGGGGTGGGTSIALFVDGAQVTVAGSTLKAGGGGSGGAGGAGGPGATGSAGTAGTSTTCQPSSCSGGFPSNCNLGTKVTAAAGAAGGTGGTGSTGGQGGGGAGGDSYAVILGGGGQVAVSGASLVAGNPGASLGNGPMGVAAMQGTF